MGNDLAEASSSYLRSAAHQPVAWRRWNEASFALARQENKPILLDVGAVWCHWCHVMDRESYENPETAALINRHFVPIKVDRDERPDVDSRYQLAVSALTGQGGWPLTAFLTPDGEPFFGGTYFPPSEGFGRPSFRRVLDAIAEAYRQQPGQVKESARRVMEALSGMEQPAGEASAPLTPALLDTIYDAAVRTFDSVHGGFGHAPKFPHPAAVDLLLDRFRRGNDMVAGNIAFLTLDKMARGGVYDQLGGGFHRYSVDEHWGVPHFEKMAYDNSELLKNYVHAAQATGSRSYFEVALDIMRWVDEWLSDRARGGFYASQDADTSLDDDGDYFTWTREEARAALDDGDFALAADYFDLAERGPMHHNPAKNVLAARESVAEWARRRRWSETEAREALARVKQALYAARLRRPAPFVDRTVYAGWNGLFISAYLAAYSLLPLAASEAERQRLEQGRDFALRSLDRLLAEITPGQGLRHALFTAPAADAPPRRIAEPVYTLEDQVFTALAALDAFEETGAPGYFEAGRELADICLRDYADPAGGFADIPRAQGAALGALSATRKPLQDSPTPSGNAAAAWLCLRLHALTDEVRWQEAARQTLEYFAGAALSYGIFAGTYALAAQVYFGAPLQVVVLEGEDGGVVQLLATARAGYRLGKSVIRLPAGGDSTRLPSALAAIAAQRPAGADRRAMALVCTGRVCQPPAHESDELTGLLAALETKP
ncbi:MAG: thioredoxin domain-containing protein [Terriglobales bacterium]